MGGRGWGIEAGLRGDRLGGGKGRGVERGLLCWVEKKNRGNEVSVTGEERRIG